MVAMALGSVVLNFISPLTEGFAYSGRAAWSCCRRPLLTSPTAAPQLRLQHGRIGVALIVARSGATATAPAPPPAPGFFPGLPELQPRPDAVAKPLSAGPQVMKPACVEETRLLKEQTKLLVQEVKLFRDVLQRWSAKKRLRRQPIATSDGGTDVAPPAESAEAEAGATPPPDSAVPRPVVPAGSPPSANAGLAISGATFNAIMAGRKNGQDSYRRDEFAEVLGNLGKKIKERRDKGELPLGQVKMEP